MKKQDKVKEVSDKAVKAEIENAEIAKQAVAEMPVESKKTEKANKSAKSESKKGKKDKLRGFKYAEAKKALDKSKSYDIDTAIKEIKKVKYAGFVESIELHVNLGIDPKNTDQRVRFTTSLPFGTGKSVKVLVISKESSSEDGNVIYRDVKVIDEIVAGKFNPGKDFNVVITTPEFMKDIAKAAKVLGPKGLMPNPKNNTVTNDVKKTVLDLSKGQVEIKNQSGHAVLHMVVGNVSFKDSDLSENIKHVISELNRNTPSKLKKKFVQAAFVATTMGPSLRLAL